MKNILNYFLNKEWILNIVMLFLSDETKERIYIAKLRAEMLFWGHDLSNMSDKEIKQGASDMTKHIQCMGITVEQATKAFMQLGKASKDWSQITFQ